MSKNQKVEINIFADNGQDLGTLEIRCDEAVYISEKDATTRRVSNMLFTNVPMEFDNKTPIIYYENNAYEFANLMLLEAKDYQLIFKSNVDDDLDVFHTLKQNYSHKPFKPFSISKNVYAGTLNFNSFLGKTFIDIKKGNKTLFSLPIEIRSRKMDYEKHYPKMISDLSQYALGLIYEPKSPLFIPFETVNELRNNKYELFMYLEFLFRPENLPTTFEYLSRNLHSRLIRTVERKPISLARNVGVDELLSILNSPENLIEIKDDSNYLSNELNGYFPSEIDEAIFIDSIDTPENRFFKYFLESVNYIIESLLEFKEIDGYVNDKLREFSDEISYYLSNRFFKDISKLEYVPLNSQVLQKKEGYKEILNYYIILEFSYRMKWGELSDLFKGHEKKLSDLYEIWCFFELLKVVTELTETPIAYEDVYYADKENWSIKLKKNEDSKITFKDYYLENKKVKLSLFYNKIFSKTTNIQNKSYSNKFHPDYSLLIELDKTFYYLHFDAKYKLKKNSFNPDDINKMHAYKDAIYNTKGAYILYPGKKQKYIFKECDNHFIPSVGAFRLIPNNNVESDEACIKKFIKNALEELITNDNQKKNKIIKRHNS